MVNEQTPPNDLEEINDEEVLDTEEEVEAQDDNEPDELEVLRSKVAQLEENGKAIEDLKRSVGRFQSIASKMESSNSEKQLADLRRQMDDQYSAIGTQLEALVQGSEDLDPAVKQRILEAQNQARQNAAVQKAVAEQMEKINPPQPQGNPQVSNLERELENTITAAGLNPDDSMFDWAAMSTMLASDPSGSSVRAHVVGKILEAKVEEASATRRTAAKKQAGKGAPDANSATPDPASRMEQAMNGGDFESAYKELMKLRSGVTN